MTNIPLPDTAREHARAILGAVFKALDDVNELLAQENRLAKSPETVLIGPDAVLDSMAFVNLIAAVEERVEESLGIPIRLTESDAGIDTQTFRTVGTLADYISRALPLARHGSGT